MRSCRSRVTLRFQTDSSSVGDESTHREMLRNTATAVSLISSPSRHRRHQLVTGHRGVAVRPACLCTEGGPQVSNAVKNLLGKLPGEQKPGQPGCRSAGLGRHHPGRTAYFLPSPATCPHRKQPKSPRQGVPHKAPQSSSLPNTVSPQGFLSERGRNSQLSGTHWRGGTPGNKWAGCSPRRGSPAVRGKRRSPSQRLAAAEALPGSPRGSVAHVS